MISGLPAGLDFDGLKPWAIIDSGRKKFGAIICDNAQLGVNAAVMPGTIIEPGAVVMPGTMARGIISNH